jgi:hypothetical protein
MIRTDIDPTISKAFQKYQSLAVLVAVVLLIHGVITSTLLLEGNGFGVLSLVTGCLLLTIAFGFDVLRFMKNKLFR